MHFPIRRVDKPLALLLGALVLIGCRGTPPPATQTEGTPAPTLPPAAAAPAVTPSAPALTPAPVRDDAPVVVDAGEDESTAPKTLVEAARAERERRAAAGKPVAVITDKNLHEYAAKGQLTVADPKDSKKKTTTAPASPTAAAPPAASATDPAVRDEQYWRSHALEIRLRWRGVADEVKRLEQRSTELRQRFYSENDSFVRDNQIKPEWDRVVDRLRQARAEVDAARVELAAFLEEGRRANALPGWLREGEDQEPQEPAKKKDRLPAPQSIEPPVLGEETPPGGWR